MKGMRSIWGERFCPRTVPLVYMEEEGEQRQDGAQSDHVYGCYMHGIFDMSETVKTFLAAVLRKKE